MNQVFPAEASALIPRPSSSPLTSSSCEGTPTVAATFVTAHEGEECAQGGDGDGNEKQCEAEEPRQLRIGQGNAQGCWNDSMQNSGFAAQGPGHQLSRMILLWLFALTIARLPTILTMG
jgi:hypothetical protein